MAPLDAVSRKAVGRFGVKLVFALTLAAIGREPFLLAASCWLSIYGLVTGAVGVLLRERVMKQSFNHWDEALWLTFAAITLMIIYRGY